MANLTRNQATSYLRELGFRIRTINEYKQQLRSFQLGWNLGPQLRRDGVMDTATSNAVRKSVARRRAGLPDLSAHFSYREFACKCGGQYSSCRRILILRPEVQSLEKYRAEVRRRGLGRGVKVISGYRCPSHNRAVRGARNSQHMYGGSADVVPIMDKDTLRRLRIAAGIGWVASNDKVAHIDRRDKTGHNTTGGTLRNPTMWRYRK